VSPPGVLSPLASVIRSGAECQRDGCPATRSWQGFGLGKGDGRGVGAALVDVDRSLPGQRFVGSDGVELDPVCLGLADQVQGVVDGLAVEPFVLQ
jgi:hypothetical protein